MKLTTTRERLLEGLGAVSSALPPKFPTLPILGNVLIEAENDTLRITATDLDCAVTTTIPADISIPGAVTVPGKRLIALVKEFPEAAVRFSTKENDGVVLDCARARFELHGLPREEFPTPAKVSYEASWSVTVDDLLRMLDNVGFAASTEDARPILNSVLWQARGDRMRMVATNGHVLSYLELAAVGQQQDVDLILPAKLHSQIKQAFSKQDTVEVARTDSWVGFRANGTSVQTRLIEGPYPNYRQVIPTENNKFAVLDRLSLVAALRRVNVIASETTHRVRFNFAPGAVRLEVETPDVGRGKDELVAGSYEGEPLAIGFNAGYWLKILSHIDSDEVKVSMRTAETAAILTPVGGENPVDYFCLVMPLRLVD